MRSILLLIANLCVWLLNPNVHYHEVNVPEYPLFQYQAIRIGLVQQIGGYGQAFIK
jgi:hypothetical protein